MGALDVTVSLGHCPAPPVPAKAEATILKEPVSAPLAASDLLQPPLLPAGTVPSAGSAAFASSSAGAVPATSSAAVASMLSEDHFNEYLRGLGKPRSPRQSSRHRSSGTLVTTLTAGVAGSLAAQTLATSGQELRPSSPKSFSNLPLSSSKPAASAAGITALAETPQLTGSSATGSLATGSGQEKRPRSPKTVTTCQSSSSTSGLASTRLAGARREGGKSSPERRQLSAPRSSIGSPMAAVGTSSISAVSVHSRTAAALGSTRVMHESSGRASVPVSGILLSSPHSFDRTNISMLNSSSSPLDDSQQAVPAHSSHLQPPQSASRYSMLRICENLPRNVYDAAAARSRSLA